MASVSVRGLEVGFGNARVLQSLDLEIGQGEFIVLLGPSGCGKSTLLGAIAGLTAIRGGQIWIGDRNVSWAEPGDRGIGMVFQSYALYPRMTVEGNLSFGLRMARVPKAEIAKRVGRAAEILRLGPLLKRRPAELSGGQRQRVAIGRALVRDVDVFLFDEPLSNLDAKLRTELRVELKQLHQGLNSTMIFVTHDQIEAMTLADRVAVMHQGVIQQFDTPRQIYRRPTNRFVAEFVGSPSMNFLDGRITRSGGRPAMALPDGCVVDLGGYPFASVPPDGSAVSLGIRPEASIVSGDADGRSCVPVRFDVIEPMGAVSLAWGRSGGQTFSVLVDADTDLPLGTATNVHFQAAGASVFDEAGQRL